MEKSKSYKGHKFKEVDFLISESTLMNKIHKDKFLISNIVTKIMKRANDSIALDLPLNIAEDMHTVFQSI